MGSEMCIRDREIAQRLTHEELEALFDMEYHLAQIDTIYARVFT